MNSSTFEGRQKSVLIEDYVWIGTRVMILPGVVVAKGAVVAAGAVVAQKVDSMQVVGGVPAKLIKKRNNNSLKYTLSYKRLFQ